MTWFTVASRAEVRNGRRVIAHLRPGVRYRAVDIDEGKITVVGPQGSIGTVKARDAIFERDVDDDRFTRRLKRKRRIRYAVLAMMALGMMAGVGKAAAGILLGGEEEVAVLPAVLDGSYVASGVLGNGGIGYVAMTTEGDAISEVTLSHVELAGLNGCAGQVFLLAEISPGSFVGDRAELWGPMSISTDVTNEVCCPDLYGCPNSDVQGQARVVIDRQSGAVDYRLVFGDATISVGGLTALSSADGLHIGDVVIRCKNWTDIFLNGLYVYPGDHAAAQLVWTREEAIGASGLSIDHGESVELAAVTPTDTISMTVDLASKTPLANVTFGSGEHIEGCDVLLPAAGH